MFIIDSLVASYRCQIGPCRFLSKKIPGTQQEVNFPLFYPGIDGHFMFAHLDLGMCYSQTVLHYGGIVCGSLRACDTCGCHLRSDFEGCKWQRKKRNTSLSFDQPIHAPFLFCMRCIQVPTLAKELLDHAKVLFFVVHNGIYTYTCIIVYIYIHIYMFPYQRSI